MLITMATPSTAIRHPLILLRSRRNMCVISYGPGSFPIPWLKLWCYLQQVSPCLVQDEHSQERLNGRAFPLTFQRLRTGNLTSIASSCSAATVIYRSQLNSGQPLGPRATYSGPGRSRRAICRTPPSAYLHIPFDAMSWADCSFMDLVLIFCCSPASLDSADPGLLRRKVRVGHIERVPPAAVVLPLPYREELPLVSDWAVRRRHLQMVRASDIG